MTLPLSPRLHSSMALVAWVHVLATATDDRPLTAHGLPPQVQVGRFLVQADRHFRNENYAAALEVLDRVLALRVEHGLALPDHFWNQQALVAFGAGDNGQEVHGVSIALGGDVGALAGLDVTRMHADAMLNQTAEAIRALIDTGAGVNAQDDSGDAAPEVAQHEGNDIAIQVLAAAQGIG